jgi:hypothetical protein
MKKILSLLAASFLLSLAVFGATPEGNWKFSGSDGTAPKTLSIHISGTILSGTMDGLSIIHTGMEGGYFWFHVVRNGVDTLYKGQMQGGSIILHESSPQFHRVLSFKQTK